MVVELRVVITHPGKEGMTEEDMAKIFYRVIQAGFEEMRDRQVRWKNGEEPQDHDAGVVCDMTMRVTRTIL